MLAATSVCTAQSGSFGFLVNQSQGGGTGVAILGVMNLDGAGHLTGTYTAQLGGKPAQTLTGSLTGGYSSNPDGTGTLRMALDVGVTFTYATVTTDGGQGLQLVAAGKSSGGNQGGGSGGSVAGGPAGGPPTISLQGTAQSLSGSLPQFFGSNAIGSVSVSLQGFDGPGPNGGTTTYTISSSSGSGTVPNCGSGPGSGPGNWSGSAKTLTLVVSPPVSSFAGKGGSVSGNFISATAVTFCGGGGNPNYFLSSGTVSGNVSPQGAANLTLNVNGGGSGNSGGGGGGSVTTGTARAASSAPPSGSYGFQFSRSPSSSGTIGVFNFDGAGNLTGSFTSVNPDSDQPETGTFTGTYSTNPDGTGTINLAVPQAGVITLAVVVTDSGSGLLLLQTAGTENSVSFGSARSE